MKKSTLLSIALLASTFTACAEEKQHLFIMSGQSNMQALKPGLSFTPAIEAEFGKENVTVVHFAQGGKPIRLWYKDWKASAAPKPENTTSTKGKIGSLYDKLMKKVAVATKDKTYDTVTFLWMQGEKDARESHGDVYAESMKGLIAQLEKDLGRDDVNTVIGRLSDCDMNNEKRPHWTMVRDAQVKVADSDPTIEWVNTDDLNDGLNKKGEEIKNDLHYSVKGYKTFGERLAKKSIQLIKANSSTVKK